MRKPELVFNLAILFGPLALAMLLLLAPAVVFCRSPLLVLCLALYAAGLGLLLAAKVPLLRRGVWVSFGSSQMSGLGRKCYRSGYGLIGLGFILNLLLLLSAAFVVAN